MYLDRLLKWASIDASNAVDVMYSKTRKECKDVFGLSPAFYFLESN